MYEFAQSIGTGVGIGILTLIMYAFTRWVTSSPTLAFIVSGLGTIGLFTAEFWFNAL